MAPGLANREAGEHVTRYLAALLPALCLLAAGAARGLDGGSVVSESGSSYDPVAPTASEVLEIHDWTDSAFLGVRDASARGRRVALTVARQDHSVLQFGRSCIDTPLRIGAQDYTRGLGTHAESEIRVALPSGARRFCAEVGVDNNQDTGGTRGTVEFVVEAAGTELFRSPVCSGGQEPVAVDVALPAGAEELVLRALPTADGAPFDQADWAEARLTLADGADLYLDENQVDALPACDALPFSFLLDGKPSAGLLASWPLETTTSEEGDLTLRTLRWTQPGGGLQVVAEVRTFANSPAAEWVLHFENTGTADTPVISDIEPLDVGLRSGYAKRTLALHELHGDGCDHDTFSVLESTIDAGRTKTIASTGGRPSSVSAFPFFDLEYAGQGLIVGIGWTGQWAAHFTRAGSGPARLAAGMEATHLVLRPGERIRSPRILLLPWRGDRQTALNRFRRLILAHYVPMIDGEPARTPVALQTFDRYVWAVPEWATEAGQIAYAKAAHEVGADSVWLDAAWFPGGFPNGVGSWFARPEDFPRGLKPVSDAAHAKGMRFVLWFEPERVAPGSEIAREHPEFVHGGADGGLFRLDMPEARQWLTDLLSKRIEEYGIDVYRNDFNIDPLGFWQRNDAPDRVGMTEIRYVEGLYQMWDDLLRRHPGLMIDNCASGGRRLDLEMTMRAIPLWRSDTNCSPGHPEFNQAQIPALSRYLPLHAGSVWTPETYSVRSSAASGLSCEFDYRSDSFDFDLARRMLEEVHENQPYWLGDLYPLAPIGISKGAWGAYQLHRADWNAGIVLAFRREESPYPILEAQLGGLDPKATYLLEYIDEGGHVTKRTALGRDLLESCELRIERGKSLLLRYRAEGSAAPRG